MTTPRPPRPGGPKRTPKVAGRTPARPTPPVEPPVEPPTKKSRFSRTPKEPTAPATETPVVETPVSETPGEKTPVVETPEVPTPASEAPAPDTAVPDTAAADTAETTEAPTETDAAPSDDDTVTTSLAKTAAPAADADGGPRGKNRPPATKVSTIKPQSTRRAPTPPVSATAEAAKPPRGPLVGWKLVGTVTAIAIVVAVIAVIASIRPGVSLSSNEAFVNSAVTSEVTSQANSRICTIFGVQYDKLDQWQATAKSNVTGTAAQRFDEYNKAVRDALTQAGLTSGGVDCRVDSVGVKSIEGDSAVLVVNLILSQTQDQQASGSGTKRYQVSMQHVGGKWLISNFGDF